MSFIPRLDFLGLPFAPFELIDDGTQCVYDLVVSSRRFRHLQSDITSKVSNLILKQIAYETHVWPSKAE